MVAIAPLAFLGGVAAGSLARGVAAGLGAPFQLPARTSAAESADSTEKSAPLPGSEELHEQLLLALKQAGIDITHSFQIEVKGNEIRISGHVQASEIQQILNSNADLKSSLFSFSARNRLANSQQRLRELERSLADAAYFPTLHEDRDSAAAILTFDSQSLRLRS